MTNWMRMGVLCLAATAGSAQVMEIAVSGGQSRLQSKELGSGYSLDDGFRLGFRLTLNSWSYFGQEFGYGYNRTKLLLDQGGGIQNVGGMAIHQGSYNLLAYATPEGRAFRPFVTGGGHFSNFVPPGASATQGQGSTKFGVNYGGGVKVKLSERFQLRFDVRQYLTTKPFDLNPASSALKQNEISIGFGYTL